MTTTDNDAGFERDAPLGVRLVVEFEGEPRITTDLPGGALIVMQGQETRPAKPGDWIAWTDIPGLVVRYQPMTHSREGDVL